MSKKFFENNKICGKKIFVAKKFHGKKISWQKFFFFENNTIRQNSWQKIVVAKTYCGKIFFLKTIQYNLIAKAIRTLYVANLEI